MDRKTVAIVVGFLSILGFIATIGMVLYYPTLVHSLSRRLSSTIDTGSSNTITNDTSNVQKTFNINIDDLLHYTNQERQSRGIAPLSLSSALNSAAAAKAQDMVARDYWSHETPDGQQPWVFVDAAGYAYMAVGENLAYGFPDSSSTVTAWMNSPGHRDNMLNTIYDEVGFGYEKSNSYVDHGNQIIVVAFYGNIDTIKGY